MKCNGMEAVPVCLTLATTGERISAVAHYEYGKNTFGETILVSARYTDASGSVVYEPAIISDATPGDCPEAQVDREQVCYRTASDPQVRSGWARHDDSAVGSQAPNTSPAGIQFFDSMGAPLDITQAGFEIVPCAPEQQETAPAAEAFDTESYCYVTTADDQTRSGWARHQDSLVGNPNNFPNVSPSGIAYFDGLGNPVNISAPGFAVVPCAPPATDVPPAEVVQYYTTYQDIAPGESLTIAPGTDLISWVVRNRSGDNNTLQVNGGPILVLDRDEVAASGGIDEEGSTLTDTVVLEAVSGALRVMILRRA